MTNRPELPIMRQWLAGPPPAGVAAALERLRRSEDVQHIAVMPDVHVAEDVCVGTVLATRDLIYPAAVGGDIGCGMAAVAFDCAADELRDHALAARLLNGLYRNIPANKHHHAPALPPHLDARPLSDARLESIKKRNGRVQFATLGRGNHFIEFQADEEDRLWVMLHSGSRAMGQAIRDMHLGYAVGAPTGLKYLDARTPTGAAYLADAAWACAYAHASRLAMIEAAATLVADLFGVASLPGSLITCDHNHVRREMHLGRQLWVHRKGAMGAAAGVAGIIPGSMGTASYHVEGRGNAESLCSSSHGAGRSMSRHDARRRISLRDMERQMRGVLFDRRRADALHDEAPGAYKDIAAVMRAQGELLRIVRKLRPVMSCKSG